MTLIKSLRYELREGRPSLTTRIFADHPDRNRAEQWPDPNALTRAQALHLVHVLPRPWHLEPVAVRQSQLQLEVHG